MGHCSAPTSDIRMDIWMKFHVKIFEQNLFTICHFNIIKLYIYMDILDVARLDLWNNTNKL